MRLLTIALFVVLSGCANMEAMMPWIKTGAQTASAMGYDGGDKVANAVKQALDISSTRATTALSAEGGYAASGYKLRFPAQVASMTSTLRQFGMGAYVDKVENAMNGAAEQAAAEAAPLFKQAIANMEITDALGIVTGGNSAATDYFRSQTESSLRGKYETIVTAELKKTGFHDQYRAMIDVYNNLPIADKPSIDVESYVVDQGLNALYAHMAAEEALIRQDPVGRGSALIGVIFAGQQPQP